MKENESDNTKETTLKNLSLIIDMGSILCPITSVKETAKSFTDFGQIPTPKRIQIAKELSEMIRNSQINIWEGAQLGDRMTTVPSNEPVPIRESMNWRDTVNKINTYNLNNYEKNLLFLASQIGKGREQTINYLNNIVSNGYIKQEYTDSAMMQDVMNQLLALPKDVLINTANSLLISLNSYAIDLWLVK